MVESNNGCLLNYNMNEDSWFLQTSPKILLSTLLGSVCSKRQGSHLVIFSVHRRLIEIAIHTHHVRCIEYVRHASEFQRNFKSYTIWLQILFSPKTIRRTAG